MVKGNLRGKDRAGSDRMGDGLSQPFFRKHQARRNTVKRSTEVARVDGRQAGAIPTQGIRVPANDWQNEIHPATVGFRKIAALFKTEFNRQFPERRLVVGGCLTSPRERPVAGWSSMISCALGTRAIWPCGSGR